MTKQSHRTSDQMELPYWQRESYKTYKQIKHVQPKIDSTIQDYVKAKIFDSEERLLHDALQLRVHLKVIDDLPSNGVLPLKTK